MRIVGGRLKGRPLVGPEDARVRPTSDRVREAIFNILAHGIAGFDINGARVLDLFAGTGALGIEAISRGAAFALFVDDSAASRALVRSNVESLGLTGATKLFRRDATALGPAGRHDRFNLVFADPPYGKGVGEQAIESAHRGGWLAPEAVIVLEEASDTALVLPPGLVQMDRRIWGGTQAVFLRLASERS